MTNRTFDFESIVKNFKLEGKYIKFEDYGCGHINDTFAVYFEKSNKEINRYIFQRINHHVFKNPRNLMDNIEGITKYLHQVIIQNKGDPNRETLTLMPSIDNKFFYIDKNGSYWRVYLFIENATTYQIVEKPEHFYESGKAFGKLQRLLEKYPANTLFETIPDFHNTEKRFEDFLLAVDHDCLGRAKDVQEEIQFALARKKDASVLVNLLKENKLPLKVTHNDTKLNNVMIDDVTGEGICVVDLDTVMPGLSLYDFGDSIRFGANPAAEDEKDLSKVWMELSLFEQFTKGFLEQAGQSLTGTEIKYLPFSAKIMTFECGIRFLTDYLNGDNYFKIHREGHNLDRCRTQFKLVSDMERKMDDMTRIIRKYS
jgi:thiamine kinase-like enzyme